MGKRITKNQHSKQNYGDGPNDQSMGPSHFSNECIESFVNLMPFTHKNLYFILEANTSHSDFNIASPEISNNGNSSDCSCSFRKKMNTYLQKRVNGLMIP